MKKEEIKSIKIIDYLNSIGYQHVNQKGGELVYYSPIVEEKTPSFFVNLQKNVFNDFASGEKGDIIRLVQVLHSCSFAEACNLLGGKTIIPPKEGTFSFSGKIINTTKGIQISAIKPLTSPFLKEYLSSRKIDAQIANKYLKEIHYYSNEKKYYSLGFRNDSDGWEFRSKFFKGSSSPKDITTIQTNDTNELYLFEGFFDFLSALTYYKTDKPKFKTIVLNSINNLSKITEELHQFKNIHCFLDRDNQGIKTLQKLSNSFNITDRSTIYNGHKDFNEFLIYKPP